MEDRNGFIAGWRFPALLLPALLTGMLLMVVVLLLPSDGGALARFAEDFRAWCFKAEPASGHLNPTAVFTAFTEPLLLGAIIWWLWGGALSEAVRRTPAGVARWAAGGVLLAILAALPIVALQGQDARAASPEFPGADLRTAVPAPSFSLVDQNGRGVRLQDLRGRVVVITGVYAHCGLTCPTILGQARRVIAALPPETRGDVTVLAITLDPERDTPAALRKVRRDAELDALGFHFLSGPPAEVNRVLDDLGVTRKRDPKSGVIDHANLFHVVDRDGRVAFRFTIGEQQEAWLGSAVRMLVAERP